MRGSTGDVTSVTSVTSVNRENTYLPPLPVGRIELSFARRVSLLRNLLKIEDPLLAVAGIGVSVWTERGGLGISEGLY